MNRLFMEALARHLLVLLVFCLPSLGCARAPLSPVSWDDCPNLIDDIDYDSLTLAVDRSLAALAHRPATATVNLGMQRIPVSHLRSTLTVFRRIIDDRPDQPTLNLQIRRHFDLFQARGTSGFNPRQEMLITAYYQPIFEGSLTSGGPYRYPLYSIPGDLVLRHDGDTRQVGRFDRGLFTSYWTRGEIETQQRAGGYELVWLKDPVDVFVLHVQGSGLIRLPNGSLRGVHYALNNGLPYRSIGRFMVDTGRLTLDEASMDRIRTYLHQHPEEQALILHQNTSFIFFEWTSTMGAIGNLEQELVAGRSVAADQSIFPSGGLGFLRSRQPLLDQGRVTGWTDLNRFVTIHDTGSAIKGPGRLDLFWGSGNSAGLAAGTMKVKGSFYLLLLKDGLTTASLHP